ncbi:MAG: dockerin type I domain-containing protein [bacterium]
MRTKLFGTISKVVTLTLCVWMIHMPSATVQAATLDHNTIIGDSERDLAGVTDVSINTYFQQQGSQLADYTIPHDFNVYFPTGQGQWDTIAVTQSWQSATELEIYYGKTIAQLVNEWSYTSRPDRGSNSPSPGTINPLISLATMDKESAGVTGSYRTSIVSSHPITMSWIMGYGFNDRMASCVTSGGCDVDYNRTRAQYYGGPGQQIAEGVSALKRWSTNPTTISSCTSQWQNYQINGECLNITNGMTYALYRYTPNFSGNQLFLNLYNQIKSTFSIPATPPPGTDDTANDISSYTLKTYASSISLTGAKTTPVRAYFNGQLLADTGTTNWKVTFDAPVGTTAFAVQYKRVDGSVVNSKTITITRNTVGDVNSDSKVDILDLSTLSQYWGQATPPNPLVDLNSDGTVDILDLSLLAANFK